MKLTRNVKRFGSFRSKAWATAGFRILWIGWAGWLLGVRLASAELVLFERDVRPILKAHCFDCHGEGEELKGKLDLRLRRLMVAGGESGSAIHPGAPEKSLLYEKIRSGEMPKREKKLTSEQIEVIRKWLADGASTARPEPVALAEDEGVTLEERAHWAFQPVRRPPVPEVKDDRVRTPVDAFLSAAMRPRGLSFSEDASKVSLLRRVCFDLTGLPPSPEERRAFLEDNDPDAYERLVDRLLMSPRYGERWGRHWLDAAGYADSDGHSEADTPREHAHKYRDYVIGSFNADKPFDWFMVEQLAGDELAPEIYTHAAAAVRNPEAIEKLVATGFLRMGPDGTGSGGGDQDAIRNQVLADSLKIVSSTLLGLSVGCAQCHDHRYDPIPQVDYYRLRAIFEPAYDWKNWRTPAQRLISLYTEQDRARAAEVEAEARKLTEEREAKQKVYIAEALDKHLEKFPSELREPLRTAFQTPAEQRTPEQKKLLMDHPSVNINPGVLYQYNQKAADELKGMDAKIAEVRARRPVEEFVQAMTEAPGKVPVTYRFHRGDPKQPRESVGPGGLTVLAPPGGRLSIPEKAEGLPGTGRRLAFARWLTDGQHPLLARVWVNRVWMHHFGKGLVGTPADFGMLGDRPVHPELLDWLASMFVAEAREGSRGSEMGWSNKRLHRLILLSTVYRQSSWRDPEREKLDPDNRWYWRKPVQRLDAEVIRDSMLATAGVASWKMFGPPVPVREDLVGQVVVGVDKRQGDNKMPVDVPMGAEEFRRSVYVQVRRSKPLAFLNVFDAPAMELNCKRREPSTVPTQALMLMNSDFVLQQARHFAERLHREAGGQEKQIDLAFELAFSRQPTHREREAAQVFLGGQISELERTIRERENADKGDKKTAPVEAKREALVNLCQALLSANEFLYVD